MIGIPIRGRARGSAAAAYETAKRRGAQRLDFLRDYLDDLYTKAAVVGVDADCLVAQADLETDSFRSAYYVRDGNVAGFGAFDDGSNLGLQYGALKAARGHVAHMCAYLGLTDIPAYLIAADPRWQAVADAGYVGTVTTTSDLGKGRWATDPKYAEKLYARYVAYWGEPAKPTQEKPMAKIIEMPPADRQIATRKINGIGMDLLGPRTLRGICFHRAYSGNQTLQNAADWLKRPDTRGLTDLFCDKNTGKMIRTNEITGTSKDMTGWAQGPYSASGASKDGRAFRDKFGPISGKGVNVVNSDLESVEVTGNYDDPISEACKAALVQWTASRAQKLGCTSESFPISPITGLTIIYGHIEFCGKAHKICPGSVVWAFINGELVVRVKAMLRAAEGATVPTTPPIPSEPGGLWPYPDPVLPAFWAALLEGEPYVIHKGTVWYPDSLTYVVKESTKRQQYAVADDRIVGPDLKVGESFKGAAKGQSDSDKLLYVITPSGTRVNMDALDVMEDAAA